MPKNNMAGVFPSFSKNFVESNYIFKLSYYIELFYICTTYT